MPKSGPAQEDEVRITYLVEGEVQTFGFPVDYGVTPEKQRLLDQLYEHVSRPASQVVADASGLCFIWDDGWPFKFVSPAWPDWWGDRGRLEGVAALAAVFPFEPHLYGNVVGPKVARDLAAGAVSLWEATRDFPPIAQYSPEVQTWLRATFERGEPVRPKRGERSAEYRKATLDSWLTTVSRVEEFRRRGLSLMDAFAQVAKVEGRKGRNPTAAVRREYQSGKRWQRFFEPETVGKTKHPPDD